MNLSRLQALLDEHVAQGSAPGMVAVLSRDGERHVLTAGRMSSDAGAAPMRRDAIFRIASMTKPVTAVAALMLMEDQALRLDAAVERWLPELTNLRVLRSLDAALDDTVPLARPITVADILTFRMGWGLLFDPSLPVVKEVRGLPGFGMPDPTCSLTPDAYMRRLSELPLMAQPGERWLYTAGSNILGVLIARVAGKPLDVVLRERIFAPLGMADSGFWIPPEKISRTVTGYRMQDGRHVLFDAPDGRYTRPPAFPAGDSGLVSTADDFAAFAEFLCSGRQLISAATLQAMRTNYLTAEQMAGGELILGAGWGWGYGVGVQVGTSPYGIARGAYGWNGGFGTSWYNDPSRRLTAILLTQRLFDSPDPPQVHKDFWRAAS